MQEALIKINPDLQVTATVPFEVCAHCAALTGRMDLFNITIGQKSARETVRNWNNQDVHCGLVK